MIINKPHQMRTYEHRSLGRESGVGNGIAALSFRKAPGAITPPSEDQDIPHISLRFITCLRGQSSEP